MPVTIIVKLKLPFPDGTPRVRTAPKGPSTAREEHFLEQNKKKPGLHAKEGGRPASRQHQQAALASSTRASAQPSASLPCGCQHEQWLRTRPCARPSTPWSGSNRGKGRGLKRESNGEAFVCVCVYASVCAHAHLRMCTCNIHTRSVTFVFLCAFH